MAVTISHFSRQARELARSNRIELWDRHKLLGAIMTYGPQYRAARQATPGADGNAAWVAVGTATVDDAARLQTVAPLLTAGPTPACPRCGSPMMLRRSKRGRFWGCSRFPS
ncbi:MAG: topoisomerase DNA-binding C4 zinc finger domain-containing protein [Symbiobacteriia bacterium]